MKTHTILVAATLLATPAFAQNTTAPQPNNMPAAKPGQTMTKSETMTKHMNGQWRASKLIGVDVYNQQNEKLGEINELILTSNGQVTGAVIGVGGFLGMGERDVMVPLDKLSFAKDPSSTTGSAADKQWYPDRAVLNANKDQLKQMPEFKY